MREKMRTKTINALPVVKEAINDHTETKAALCCAVQEMGDAMLNAQLRVTALPSYGGRNRKIFDLVMVFHPNYSVDLQVIVALQDVLGVESLNVAAAGRQIDIFHNHDFRPTPESIPETHPKLMLSGFLSEKNFEKLMRQHGLYKLDNTPWDR